MMTEKSNFLRKFNEAFAENDLDFILGSLSDDIVWEMVGDKKMTGKEEVRTAIQEMKNVETLEMKIFHTITHGKTAAANGRMKIKEPSGEIKSFGFCDIYGFNSFKNPKINKMTSYVVPLQSSEEE